MGDLIGGPVVDRSPAASELAAAAATATEGAHFRDPFVDMSKLFSRFLGLFRSRTLVGVDKHGNRYFTRMEQIDGIMKEKRMVIFKGEEEPRSLPVEWICWLNGQRKTHPTPDEIIELEQRREQVKQNTARLKEDEAMKSKEKQNQQRAKTGKVSGPDLRSFVQQLKGTSGDQNQDDTGSISEVNEDLGQSRASISLNADAAEDVEEQNSSEPTGSGASFRPGTWKPPT